MLKQSIVVSVAAPVLAAWTIVASAATGFPSRSSVVLQGSEARVLERTCSRGPVGPVSGNWSPALTQITDLEKRLFPLLREQLSRERSHRRPEDYLRQYVGFVIDGRKVIYVNGVHRGYIEEIKQLRVPGSDWEHQAIFVCDGGDDFFGAEYDVDAKSVKNLSFNGRV